MADCNHSPLLEVEDLRVHFETEDGLVKAVDGISYTVDRGQTLGIVGESGSAEPVSRGRIPPFEPARMRPFSENSDMSEHRRAILEACSERMFSVSRKQNAGAWRLPWSSRWLLHRRQPRHETPPWRSPPPS